MFLPSKAAVPEESKEHHYENLQLKWHVIIIEFKTVMSLRKR